MGTAEMDRNSNQVVTPITAPGHPTVDAC